MNLVDVEVVNAVIKHVVEVVEELDDLVCRAVGADGGEAHDVTEEDRGCLEHLGLRHLSWGKILSQEIFVNTEPFLSFLMTEVGSRELSSFSVFRFSA